MLRWLIRRMASSAVEDREKVAHLAENFAILFRAVAFGGRRSKALSGPNRSLISPPGLAPEWDNR